MQGSRGHLDIVYHVDNLPDDSERFRAARDWVLTAFELSRISASISIVDDPTIHRINREYLNHDWPTDVISFVFDDTDGQVDGEVIASADTATKLYEAAGWELADEILLYVVHGLLHLAGLSDTDPKDREQMRIAERTCLLDLGIAAAQDHLDRWQDISY